MDNEALFDLPAIEALAVDTPASALTLSGTTIHIILSAVFVMREMNNWVGSDPNSGLTDAELDQIDAMISLLETEVMAWS